MEQRQLLYTDSLAHHGILGQKWGIRRYQNSDGSLTAAGKIRYGIEKVAEKAKETANKKLAAEKAKRDDIEKRKQAAANRQKLIKMAKKHPDWLTDQELDALNNRYNKENNFDRNYKKNKKQQSKELNDLKKAILTDVITPTAVELGKSVVAAMIAGGDVGNIAKYRVTDRLFKNVYGTQNSKNNNTGNNSENTGGKNKNKNKSNKEKKRAFIGIGTVKVKDLPKGATFKKK